MSIRQGDTIIAGNPNMDKIQQQYDSFVAEVEERITPIRDHCSYFEFIRWDSGKDGLLDCAFGKGNEDLVVGIGRQMAMYAWYKGTDKNDYPFETLIEMPTLSDMSADAFSETMMNDSLRSLIEASDYASEKVMDKHSYQNDTYFDFGNGYKSKEAEETLTVTDENLNAPFYFGYSVGSESSGSRVSVYLNNVCVLLQALPNATGKDILQWSDYGITEPGEYIIRIVFEKLDGYEVSMSPDIEYELIAKKG